MPINATVIIYTGSVCLVPYYAHLTDAFSDLALDTACLFSSINFRADKGTRIPPKRTLGGQENREGVITVNEMSEAMLARIEERAADEFASKLDGGLLYRAGEDAYWCATAEAASRLVLERFFESQEYGYWLAGAKAISHISIMKQMESYLDRRFDIEIPTESECETIEAVIGIESDWLPGEPLLIGVL